MEQAPSNNEASNGTSALDDGLTVVRVGKKAAGRDLGGKLHDGYPEAKP